MTVTYCRRSPEEHLRIRFLELGLEPQAYSCIRYVGTKTSSPPTDFSKIKFCISNLLKDNSVRAPRSLQVVLSALKVCGADWGVWSRLGCVEQIGVCGADWGVCMEQIGMCGADWGVWSILGCVEQIGVCGADWGVWS